MSPMIATYAMLAFAIMAEVAGSSFLKASEGFTRLWPSLAVVGFYLVSFYLLAMVLKVIPLGVTYAIWSGLGIVFTALVGLWIFRQSLDLAAMAGIGLILAGVLVMNLFSKSAGH